MELSFFISKVKQVVLRVATLLWALMFWDERIILEFTRQGTESNQVPLTLHLPQELERTKWCDWRVPEPYPFLPGISTHHPNSQRTRVRISSNCA